MNSSCAARRKYFTGYERDVLLGRLEDRDHPITREHFVQHIFVRKGIEHPYSIIINQTTRKIVFIDFFTHDSIHSIYFRNGVPTQRVVFLGVRRAWPLIDGTIYRHILVTDEPVFTSDYSVINESYATQLGMFGVNHTPGINTERNVLEHAWCIRESPEDWNRPWVLTQNGTTKVFTGARRSRKKTIHPVRETIQPIDAGLFYLGTNLQHTVRWTTPMILPHRIEWLVSGM